MAEKRYSILIADESSGARDALRGTLEPEGYEVVSATSGREAIHIIRSELVHLVVMDVRLPDYSGFETYHAIKDIRDLFLPCIFTALEMTADSIQDALSEEAVTILPKPVDTPRLVHAVDWSIGRYYAPGVDRRRPRDAGRFDWKVTSNQ